jgi:adenosylcobinamide kinase/adenosylcobinamide-phosphate guanylyltransferase
MKRGKFYFIFGGARSGKSSFAEKLASSLGEEVTYIATAEALDEEMAARIREHKRRRPASWNTIEEPYRVTDVLETIGKEGGVILIDCLTLLLTNLFYKQATEQDDDTRLKQVLSEINRLAKTAKECSADVLIVSNEVGLGVVPDYPDGRLFRDLTGWANQIMTQEADNAYFMVSGMALDIKALRVDPR